MKWFEKIERSRPPDFIIGEATDPYMLRWWIIPRNKIFNIYLHKFLHDDNDEALHDHPWVNMSILLFGEYTEHTIDAGGVHKAAVYKKGNVKIRRAKNAHRVQLHNGPCWSLFITGPVVREWGFHCPKGWQHWRIFLNNVKGSGSTGKGCNG